MPESNTRPERQIELLFGEGATLFPLLNYIDQEQTIFKYQRTQNQSQV
jgi:hypothetical protein